MMVHLNLKKASFHFDPLTLRCFDAMVGHIKLSDGVIRQFGNIDIKVTFEAGMTSWTAYGNGQSTSRWKYCELVREEDKLKYAKGVEC